MIIIDSWLLYNYKQFKANNFEPCLKFFPVWNKSTEVNYQCNSIINVVKQLC